MSSQKYERVSLVRQHAPVLPLYVSGKAEAHFHRPQVSANDEDNCQDNPERPSNTETTPSSPPPSFRSRASSPSSRHLLSEDPITTEAERTLADTFDDGSDSDDDGHKEGDDRQRLMRASTHQSESEQRVVHDGNGPNLPGAATRLPVVVPPVSSNVHARPYTGSAPFSTFSHSNDGVFANLNAKPERGEKLEEQPPVSQICVMSFVGLVLNLFKSYEAAAADATPPYWETTILAPGHLASSDEVYVDGLPVGSLFSFVWNAMISMSFTLVGFLLTYLLHTTHAAKNGSKAGLGITLVQYGFYMRSGRSTVPPPTNGQDSAFPAPQDPNSHDFDPNTVSDSAATAAAAAIAESTQQAAASGATSVANSDWLAYALMIVGWFILIRAVSDFFKARRHEQLVLQSPDRGLNVPVVADTERPEEVV
ncbi:MAG: hypothetical protein Q9175_004747 [Cornicularia normoerica]